MMSTPPKWAKLPYFPFKYFSNPFFINDNELIVCPATNDAYRSEGIHKFSIKHNKWIKMFNYDLNSEFVSQSAAYDKKSKQLYIWGKDNKLLQFDLNLNQLKPLINSSISGNFVGLIHDETDLHQIG